MSRGRRKAMTSIKTNDDMCHKQDTDDYHKSLCSKSCIYNTPSPTLA